ncbi:EAL domain-containing protein [Rhizobiaceae bacterium]|nr:EAL domain-containing protein [Rhizobiaceae bacterium]
MNRKIHRLIRYAFGKRSQIVQSALLATIAIIFTASAWMSVRSIDKLLNRDAKQLASQWAQTFAVQMGTIDRLFVGGGISVSERTKLEKLAAVGAVFRFKVYQSNGTLRLTSEALGKTGDPITLKTFQDVTDPLMFDGNTHSVIEDGDGHSDRPEVYAKAYVPLKTNGVVQGALEIYVDQTERRAEFATTLWRTIWLTLALSALAVCHTIYTVWLLRRERKADAQARYLSRHDVLTGAANRAVFNENLEAAVRQNNGADLDVGVLMLDLDGFKAVNDTYGHSVGDSLLKLVAVRLSNEMRRGDTLARLGGDEFAIIQTDVQSEASVRSFAERLVSVIRKEYSVDGRKLRISTSIGFAMATDLLETGGAESLLARADIALYRAKEAGRDRVTGFRVEMEAELHAREALRDRVRNAVDTGELVVHYQPQHSVEDGSLLGFEALVRLPDGKGGLVSPADFIPVAEQMQLMDKLGARVLEIAARDAAKWPSHLRIAVNLSVQQFAHDIVSEIEGVLANTGLPAARLELEITESLFITDPDEVGQQLLRLKKLGARIAMDDFGTGYSSLNCLWQFPFDKLKIDRSCFQELARRQVADKTGAGAAEVIAILNTIGAMAKTMGLRLTAEGVETQDQIDHARAAGCDEVQGYLYGKPMAIEQAAAHILTSLARSTNPPVAKLVELSKQRCA